jgi:hypothetical protein
MAIIKAAISLALLAAFVALHAGRAQDVPPSPTDWAPFLEQRTVEITEASTSDGVPGVRALFAVAGSRERVWGALVDYGNFPKMFRGIDRVEVLEKDVHHAVVEVWVDGEIGKLHYVLDRRYERPGYHLSWRKLSGDLQRIEGSWEIRDTPRAGTLLLVYQSYVEIGWFIPSSLYQWVAKRRTAEMATAFRRWIEAHPTKPDRSPQ